MNQFSRAYQILNLGLRKYQQDESFGRLNQRVPGRQLLSNTESLGKNASSSQSSNMIEDKNDTRSTEPNEICQDASMVPLSPSPRPDSPANLSILDISLTDLVPVGIMFDNQSGESITNDNDGVENILTYTGDRVDIFTENDGGVDVIPGNEVGGNTMTDKGDGTGITTKNDCVADINPITDNDKEETTITVPDGGVGIITHEDDGENIVHDNGDGVGNMTANDGEVGKESWKKNIQKQLRAKGMKYVGRKYEGGKYVDSVKEAREVGERCACQKPQSNLCRDITDQEMRTIFNKVWKMTWEEKKVFVLGMTERVDCKRRRVESDDNSRKKQFSFQYYVSVSGQKKKVCFKFFLSTTGLKETWIRDVLRKHSDGQDEPRPLNRKATISQRREILRNFLGSLPKVESHYCRKSSSKLYLEPVFQSLASVYRLYTNSVENPLSRCVFEEEFKLMNLSVFHPRKDQCDTCVAFKEGNLSEDVFIAHRAAKERAQVEKTQDKERSNAGTSDIKVVTVDLQCVLLCPMCKASALYYRTKLCVHNYTVFDLQTKAVRCYVWNEVEGGVAANEFATCLLDYLQQHISSYTTFIIYSDGCTAQNRNAVLSSALSFFAQRNNVTIIQKFLVKGHTQMEVDSAHSCIERELKNKKIQVPSDYVTHIENARKTPMPYEVKYLDHSFFQDFSKVSTLKSIRPGRSAGDPVVTDLRALMYTTSGEIKFKLNFDDPWNDLPPKRCESTNVINEPSPLYESRLNISESKFKHLQELKSVIHADNHPFYDALPH